MIPFLFLLINTIKSPQFLVIVIIISFFIKVYFLSVLIKQGLNRSTIYKPWVFLIGTIAGSLFGDVSWIIKLMREIFTLGYSYSVIAFSIRIAWAFLVFQYVALSLFIQSLAEKQFKLKLFHKIQMIITSSFSLYFLYIAFFYSSTLVNEYEREIAKQSIAPASLEFVVMRWIVLYLLFFITLPGLYLALQKIRKTNLPKILRKQLKICIINFICPFLFAEFLQAGSFTFLFMEKNLYPIVSFSTLLLSYMIYYCMRKVMGLRFLNFSSHVENKPKLDIITDFKTVLEQLSCTTSLQELRHITKTFFKEAFGIPLRNTSLYIRKNNPTHVRHEPSHEDDHLESLVEYFMNNHQKETCEIIKNTKLFIFDEITFSHFYEETNTWHTILTFLKTIHADVFIPVYTQQKIIAYIIIEKNTRPNECYSANERDNMLLFASYLGNIINFLQNKNIELLIQQEKKLREELYIQEQENKQYKESIKSFIRPHQHKMVGIIYYKNRHFTFSNQAAKELITINPNRQEGHPLAKALKQVAHHVETYKTPHICFAKNSKGTTIILSGVSNLEKNNVLIIIAYPELSDLIMKQKEWLQDPSDWNYLLYLETTTAGSLISQLLPGTGEKLLNFKIALFKAALSQKTLLLDMPDGDLIAIVELIHHISSRQTLHILELTDPAQNLDNAIKLFGTNQLDSCNNHERPLFEKLNNTGTLFIKNIQFLDHTSQEHLTEFILYKLFRKVNSDQKHHSNVRITCSVNRMALEHLSPDLYQILQSNILTMPTLTTLPIEELYNLADSFAEQALKTQTFKKLLTLTENDKEKFAYKRPASLQELKAKIHQILIQKSKETNLYHETTFDPAYEVTDPELVEAARLGKYALKDCKIMTTLWHKFKNQNKIATFLGVNRSSVNRRCKKYNLQ